MTRTVGILMLCIILMGTAFGQIRSDGSIIQRLVGNRKTIPTEKEIPQFNINYLPKELRSPAVEAEEGEATPPREVSRRLAAAPQCIRRSSGEKQCSGVSEWVKRIYLFGMWFEIHFRFEGKWVNINGQCVCKHFLTIRSACFYRVDCYQVCPWPLSSNYGTFNAISEEQDSTWVPITPQCAAMSPFKRFIDWILFTIVSGRFEPSASSSSFCIAGNTMYWSNGCVLQWQWGAPPSKAKEIWFCL